MKCENVTEVSGWRNKKNAIRAACEAAVAYYLQLLRHCKNDETSTALLNDSAVSRAVKIVDDFARSGAKPHSLVEINELIGRLDDLWYAFREHDIQVGLAALRACCHGLIAGAVSLHGPDGFYSHAFLDVHTYLQPRADAWKGAWRPWPDPRRVGYSGFNAIAAKWRFVDLTNGRDLPREVFEAFESLWLIDQHQAACEMLQGYLIDVVGLLPHQL